MGDHTTVTITLRKSDYKTIEDNDVLAQPEYLEEHDNLISLTGTDINYGDWTEVEDYLQENKIEYDKRWERGGDYDAGNLYYRHVDGEYISFEIYDCNQETDEWAQKLMSLLKEDKIEEIKKEIEKVYKKYNPFKISDLDEPKSVRFLKKL